MIKATVLYGHPEKPAAFEKYYSETHMPIVAKTSGIVKAETTKMQPNPDGSKATYYRMAELYFDGPSQMQKAMGSAEGQAMVADLRNFATGGVTVMVGVVENFI